MKKKTKGLRSLKIILPHILRYKWRYIIGLVSLITVDTLQMLIPLLLKNYINGLKAGKTLQEIYMYPIIIVIIAASMITFRIIWRMNIVGTSRRVETDLRDSLYSHLLRLDSEYFANVRTGDLMAKLTNDIQAVRMVAGPGILISTDMMVMGSLSIFAMFHLEARLAAMILIPLPLISVTIYVGGKIIHRLFNRAQSIFSDMSAKVRENVDGMRVIKAYVQEEAQIKEFQEINDGYYKTNMRLAMISSLIEPIVRILEGGVVALVIVYGGYMVIKSGLSLGSLVAFIGYLLMVIWPMIALGWVINLFQRGAASASRLLEVVDVEPLVKDEESALDVKDIKGKIEIKSLSFSYKRNVRHALFDITLNIKAGSAVAIVGQTGSGKSTLVKLIPRLIEPSRGSIYIDSIDVRNIKLDTLRKFLGYVPQDLFLFSDTLKGNITFGADDAVDREIYDVSKTAGLWRDITSFPKGLETFVGERGITLSGGQKQRVTLARAILKRPKILILDDIFSSVDADTEKEIIRGIRELATSEKRTTIIVSHRLTSLSWVDEIFVLDKGKLVEKGTHEELMKRKGLYYKLYQKQALENELKG